VGIDIINISVKVFAERRIVLHDQFNGGIVALTFQIDGIRDKLFTRLIKVSDKVNQSVL